jgi:hypothetical protein
MTRETSAIWCMWGQASTVLAAMEARARRRAGRKAERCMKAILRVR